MAGSYDHGPPLSSTPERDREWAAARRQRMNGEVNGPPSEAERRLIAENLNHYNRQVRHEAEQAEARRQMVLQSMSAPPPAWMGLGMSNPLVGENWLANPPSPPPPPPEAELRPEGSRELDLAPGQEIELPKVVAVQIEL